MPPPSPKPLTVRQRAVMQRIDRRVPIKVIAQDLGVSETRINQHIRALKNIYEAGSLGDLVERYRAEALSEADSKGTNSDKVINKQSGSPNSTTAFPFPKPKEGGEAQEFDGLIEPVYSKSQVPFVGDASHLSERDDPGNLTINDVMPMVDQAPWLRPGEPKVVPGWLDGEHAVLLRLGVIIVIAFGFLGAVVLMVTAALTISDALDGKASMPVEQKSAP